MGNQKLILKVLSNQTLSKILGTAILCLFLILPLKCLAGAGDILPLKGKTFPLLADMVLPWPPPEPTPMYIRILQILGILCIDFIVNAFVLSIGYLILKQVKLIKSWKFLKYIILVTLGGALIDLILVAGAYFSFSKGFFYPYFLHVINSSTFLTFLGLAIYNYWLSRRFFNLTKRQAVFIGLIMGIFTNPGWIILSEILY